MKSRLLNAYDRLILDHPVVTLLLLALLGAAALYYAQQFRLDASADSLTLENDQDLRYFRTIADRYPGNDFLVIAYVPKDGDLFDDSTLEHLAALRDALKPLDRVDSVLTLLDVPLLRSPPVGLSELASNVRTLTSPDTDRELARKELTSSPIYRDQLISEDGSTTAILLNLKADERYNALLERRTRLRDLRRDDALSGEQAAELERVEQTFHTYNAEVSQRRQQEIAEIREIMQRFDDQATLHLGGVQMIAADLIRFVRSDISTFGVGVFLFLVATLSVIFRKIRWVLLPLLTCASAAFVAVGALGLFDWPVTVVSSNFIALMLIITMSMTIHLIVRYRQFAGSHPQATQREVVADAVHTMARPCFYMALTTIVAFLSLLVSGIRPIIDFGWMMTLGIGIAFVLTFLLFPATLMLLPRSAGEREEEGTQALTLFFARLSDRHGRAVLVVSTLLLVAGVAGISRLAVENSFIDYFDDSTEIYQGMRLIDRQLGGTTPLDIVYRFPDDEFGGPAATADADAGAQDDSYSFGDDFSEAGDEAGDAPGDGGGNVASGESDAEGDAGDDAAYSFAAGFDTPAADDGEAAPAGDEADGDYSFAAGFDDAPEQAAGAADSTDAADAGADSGADFGTDADYAFGAGFDEPAADASDDFAAWDEPAQQTSAAAYWFTQDRMRRIGEIHRWLEQLPETGKVLSMHTFMEVAETFNDGEPLSNLALALLYEQIPPEFRSLVIDPYVSPAHDEARITLRVRDSDPDLKRDALLEKIRAGLHEEVGLEPDHYSLTNMLVLYNNMLQSLFQSQVLTLGGVILGILLMFLNLFRSVRLALIAIAPNLLPPALVLGIMGWAGIPLDMMTITIAAISVGIGVDDAIHYLHRFREEKDAQEDVRLAVAWTHATIGRAMYFTSVTIIVGFSVLTLSNFVPTIMFGVLTAVAMVLALVANLLLLPSLLVAFLAAPRRKLPVR